MNFKNIIGNENIKELLTKTIENNTVTHSYLFIGQEGIGKFLFAKEFARDLLGIEETDIYNAPDYYEINTEENSIKIEQIRLMQSKIEEKPIKSTKKIYIINDSEKMTKEAQNCLLKTLEEPPEYICIILITSNENAILNTVKSRCTKIKFNPIENKELKEYLKKNYNIQNIDENILSGSIKKALEINENKEIYNELDKYFKNIEKYQKIDVLNKIECLYKNKEKINQMLDYINTILFIKTKENIEYYKYIQYVEETKQKIKINSNYDMTIDNLILKIWR